MLRVQSVRACAPFVCALPPALLCRAGRGSLGGALPLFSPLSCMLRDCGVRLRNTDPGVPAVPCGER